MRKKSTRSKFTNEFKKKAVEMTLADDITLSAVADSLGIPNQYLSKWRADLLVDGKIAEAEKKLEAWKTILFSNTPEITYSSNISSRKQGQVLDDLCQLA